MKAEETMQSSWLVNLLRDEYFLLCLGFLVGMGSIVSRAVNRLIDAQRDIAAGLAHKLDKLSDQLGSLERITIADLMSDIQKQIDYKYAESNGEAIRRWLDYRADYGRSSPHLDEDDARAEALTEIFKDMKPAA
jgi:hypothetical protein